MTVKASYLLAQLQQSSIYFLDSLSLSLSSRSYVKVLLFSCLKLIRTIHIPEALYVLVKEPFRIGSLSLGSKPFFFLLRHLINM